MLLSSLALRLSSKELLPPATAYSWAWRIQNDYPENLRQAAELWADGKSVPNVEVTGISLEKIQAITSVSIPSALDLLYVLYRSPSEGRTILSRCARKD